MAKTDCSKVVDPSTGKVTITLREERYPRSTGLLMNNGFSVILLNMIFGLLPTTLYGCRLKYYPCSIAQAYATVFGICMIILSVIFLPLSIKVAFLENPSKGVTDTAVLLLGKLSHVCGFLFLLIRGCYVARKIPIVWSQIAKLLNISVVELHGKKYHGLKKLKRFGQYAFAMYGITMILNEYNVFSNELDKMLPQFFVYYNMHLIELTNFNFVSINAGFLIWKLCSFSHILVSSLAGFLIVAVTVCLQAGNDHLLALFENDNNLLLIKKRNKIKILETKEGNEQVHEEEKVLKALNAVKEIHVMAENVVGSISKIFGASLIIEVLILIANLLVDIFYIVVPMTPIPITPGDNSQNSSPFSLPVSADNESTLVYRRFFKNYLNRENNLYIGGGNALYSDVAPPGPGFGNILTLLGEAFIHSYFFYKLCCKTTEMVNETKEPLQILKTIPHTNFSKRVQQQIRNLKGDLASSSVTLTAANYFQINKFTLTSITSALTTYIIVLLQFNQQERDKNNTAK